MFCQSCGQEIESGAKFCPYCGAVQNAQQSVPQAQQSTVNGVQSQPKCWTVFAKLGYYFGLFGLIFCWLFGAGLSVSIPGIVFSALGRRSNTDGGKARTGLILSIIGTVAGFVLIIVWSVVATLLAKEIGSNWRYYY